MTTMKKQFYSIFCRGQHKLNKRESATAVKSEGIFGIEVEDFEIIDMQKELVDYGKVDNYFPPFHIQENMSVPVGDGVENVNVTDRSVEEVQKGVHEDPSLGSSFDGESDKFHLFSRDKPLHSALGGGKSADIILWRNKQISAGMLTSATVIWLLFEWIGYHLLTFVCHSLILTLALLFLWSNLSFFLNKAPLEFPDIVFPENLSTSIALCIRDECNLAIGIFYDVASGKDLKKFLYAILTLWIVSVVGSWFDFLTLLYMTFVMLFTLPPLYEKHEDQVDTYAKKATVQLKRQYGVLDEKVLQKLPSLRRNKQN